MAKNIKVIITGVSSRKPFDVVSIMKGYYGYDCILCAEHKSPALSLIYGQKVHKLRHHNYESFSCDLENIMNSHQDSEFVYLPVSDKSIGLFYQYIASNSVEKLHFMLPSKKFFYLANDKIAFQNFCVDKGFPVPESYSKKDLGKLEENFRPLIMKPKDGQGSMGIRFFNDPKELEQLKDENIADYILQDKIESDDKVAGAFFLCENGKVLNAHTHRRIRTFPIEGGVTVYSESNYIEDIIEIGGDLLKQMNWDGLAMIEFMYDKFAERWVVIELNPRIWGSVLLSAFNKSDLLKDYVTVCLGEKPRHNTNPEHVYIRWVFPFDLMNLFKGEIGLKDFFRNSQKKTSFINLTYAGWPRSVAFHLYLIFNLESLKRIIKKIF